MLVAILASPPSFAVELIVNGTFEGGFAGAGLSGPLDGLADSLPAGWTRFETFYGGVENSAITGFPGNGPTIAGASAVQFQRLTPNNASGDWTVIQQALNVNVSQFETLTLSMDVMVNQHNLEAGGWSAPAFEWPVVVQVNYLDVVNQPQTWRFGWYLNPPGDSNGGPVNDPGHGLIAFYNDLLVNANAWVPNTFNLLNVLPQAKTLTNIRVGSSGWNYQGTVDNVSLVGIPEPATLALLGLGLAGIGFGARRRHRLLSAR